VRLGFLIDQRRCIGCHACTVACKQEQDVPLGVFRTWVKYIEKGAFPNTRRHFTVLRCNHCDDAPCIAICPTKALFRREDGIVDFDTSRCIGCKSCMQACPYDALYIDPLEHTAQKCNFCAHRVDVGLKPACEIVCPETAIISGDLDDSESVISRLIAREPVHVRKPEQGTAPKLFYINADDLTLTPNQTRRDGVTMWGQIGTPGHEASTEFPTAMTPQRTSMAEGTARDVYDIAHPVMWGWRVSSYLWTKSIAAGAFGVAALLALTSGLAEPLGLVAATIATVFALVTVVFLVWDLKRPERFWFILLKPNPKSWLVWGAYILIVFSALAGLWGLAAVFDVTAAIVPVAVLGIAFAIAAAGYSGFLFGQAEGRDFWQSPLLPLHLVVQAALAGASVLGVAAAVMGNLTVLPPLVSLLLLSLVGHAVLVAAELVTPHANADVRLAAEAMTRGRHASLFWVGAVLIGVALPVVAMAAASAALLPTGVTTTIAAAAALAGLLAYEDSWIRAGQAVPLS
jgi:Fe-S-cluster-containing dehydrogenase component/formate-dependent nitrite reductase membrane component NrfD